MVLLTLSPARGSLPVHLSCQPTTRWSCHLRIQLNVLTITQRSVTEAIYCSRCTSSTRYPQAGPMSHEPRIKMCEVYTFRCPTCSHRWQHHRKLASCEEEDSRARCPENLCMYAGSPKKPTSQECDGCAGLREILLEYGEQGSAEQESKQR
jgi:hypothetical protein